MGVGSTPYNILLFLHLASVVYGFAPVVLSALGGSNGGASRRVNKSSSLVLYTVPIWGMGLVGMSDDQWELTHLWIWSSLVLWFVMVGLSHAVLFKSGARLEELSAGGQSSQTDEAASLRKKVGTVGGLLNVLLVVIIALMIFKPTL